MRTERRHRKAREREEVLRTASKIVPYTPLIAVFILALLAGFAGRVLLPQQSPDGALLSTAGAGASAVNRRRLNDLLPAFRINPLAGQLPAAQPGSPGVTVEPFFPIDTDGLAQHAMAAPAARDAAAAGKLGEASEGLAAASNLGRRLAPGLGPRPAPAAASPGDDEVAAAAAGESAPAAAVPARKPVRGADGELLPLAAPLRVCLLTADFQGLPNAGPIATAYTLLAAALGTDPSLKVQLPLSPASQQPQPPSDPTPSCAFTFSASSLTSSRGMGYFVVNEARAVDQVTMLGVSKDLEACGRMATGQHQLNPAVQYTCLQQAHFLPPTVNTQPFEQLSHAVVNWLLEHQHDCDIVQARQLMLHANVRHLMSPCQPIPRSEERRAEIATAALRGLFILSN